MSKNCITVPGRDVDVLSWFEGCFDSAFAVLHPFIRVEPRHRALFKYREHWPTRDEFNRLAVPVPWREVSELLQLPRLSGLNELLLGSIGAIVGPSREVIRQFAEALESHSLVAPDEGDFPPILLHDFFRSFADLGYTEIVVGDEFGKTAIQRPVTAWLSQEAPYVGEAHPTMYSLDRKVLYGVHWDSFFTFLCGPQHTVTQIVAQHSFEGFFFRPGDRVYW
jgi:hypothetical protein